MALLFDFATKVVFENEPIYMNTERKVSAVTTTIIQEAYDSLFDELLEEIFEEESRLPRDIWEETVLEKCSWILCPHQIR
jgi:hypothetical protein